MSSVVESNNDRMESVALMGKRLPSLTSSQSCEPLSLVRAIKVLAGHANKLSAPKQYL